MRVIVVSADGIAASKARDSGSARGRYRISITILATPRRVITVGSRP